MLLIRERKINVKKTILAYSETWTLLLKCKSKQQKQATLSDNGLLYNILSAIV